MGRRSGLQRRVGVLISILISFLLIGCNKEVAQEHDENREPVQVDLHVPEQGDVNEPIEISATVTQGEERVEDADEVVFEIWENGKKDESEMIEYEYQENGTYYIEISFPEEGTFHVQVHVTARRMHVMPTKQITIGPVETGEHGEEDE